MECLPNNFLAGEFRVLMGILFHILTSDVVIKLCLYSVLVFVKENLPEVTWRVCI